MGIVSACRNELNDTKLLDVRMWIRCEPMENGISETELVSKVKKYEVVSKAADT